jgi:hypothetical protein
LARDGCCACCGERGPIYARGLIAKCYERLRRRGGLGNYQRIWQTMDIMGAGFDDLSLDDEDGELLRELRRVEVINQHHLLEAGGPRLERMLTRAFREDGYYVPLYGGSS